MTMKKAKPTANSLVARGSEMTRKERHGVNSRMVTKPTTMAGQARSALATSLVLSLTPEMKKMPTMQIVLMGVFAAARPVRGGSGVTKRLVRVCVRVFVCLYLYLEQAKQWQTAAAPVNQLASTT